MFFLHCLKKFKKIKKKKKKFLHERPAMYMNGSYVTVFAMSIFRLSVRPP